VQDNSHRYVDVDEDMEGEDDRTMQVAPADDEDNDLEEAEEDEEDEDEDEDAQGDTDEENTIHLKPPEERAEIEQEIAELEEAVPELTEDYRIVDRLGTGTFSSVYKAVDINYEQWDNKPWKGIHPPASSAYYQSAPRPSGSKVFVAIKRIYVTSSPERIRNEIAILEDCRACRHVSQLITAFRQGDQVVAIMPYQRNEDFRVRTDVFQSSI
jgi:cell division control protein 7